MQLIKVTKGGALHYELSDGRIGATYPSGMVRVQTKQLSAYSRAQLMYQINPKDKNNGNRILIKDPVGRYNLLRDFNNKNCRKVSTNSEAFGPLSSVIVFVEYKHYNKVLVVHFNGGSVYSYENVSYDVYSKFLNSKSKGKFFVSKVKNKYKINKYWK
jgi:hypothetical protein